MRSSRLKNGIIESLTQMTAVFFHNWWHIAYRRAVTISAIFSIIIAIAADPAISGQIVADSHTPNTPKSHKILRNVQDYHSVLQEAWILKDNTAHNRKKISEIDTFLTDRLNRYTKHLDLFPALRQPDIVEFKNEAILFSAYNQNLKLPWSKHDNIYRNDLVSVIGSNGNWLLSVLNPIESYSKFIYESLEEYDYFVETIFNGKFPESHYYLVETILKTNQESLHRASSKQEYLKFKAALWVLAICKSQYTWDADDVEQPVSSFFAFKLPNVKGFQIGAPNTSKFIRLILFPKDNQEITVEIFQLAHGKIKQDEIDYIVRNFSSDH